VTPPEARHARLVLLDGSGIFLGVTRPIPVETPWWQDIGPVVRAALAELDLTVVVLRILEAERPMPPGGLVTYLAELPEGAPVPSGLHSWDATFEDHPLRMPWARPGGPAADLAWAHERLAALGETPLGPGEQIRTWNLSSLWRLPLVGGSAAWLKHVPPFFDHEGRLLERLAGGPVPPLLAQDGGRILMPELSGSDLYDAGEPILHRLVDLLVDLQTAWLGSANELLALGLPDWRGPALADATRSVLDRCRALLPADDAAALDAFVDDLPDRFALLDQAGIPDSLVHGDFHPGNARGDEDGQVLLDWGDAGVGHPLLDQAAYLDRVPAAAVEGLRTTWHEAWRRALPDSDPEAAALLLRPVAAARQAVIYQGFLDRIEPSERPYHRDDPLDWLQRTAALSRAEERTRKNPGLVGTRGSGKRRWLRGEDSNL
jgi:hypothetical protein